MPQNQNYRWEVEYQGYKFTFDSPTKPTDDDVYKAYTDYLSQKDTPRPQEISINVDDIETTDSRANRNAEEVGSFEADKIYQDAKFWDRFGESFRLGLPHFGLFEPKLEPADEPWEFLAEATGGITGAAVGLGLTSRVAGGVLTPLKGPMFTRKLAQVKSLMKQARKANRAGDVARAANLRRQAEHTYNAHQKLFRDAYVGSSKAGQSQKNWMEFYGYKKYGLLGNIGAYEKAIKYLSLSSPRLARAANLFVSNTATFAAHGQAQLKPWEKFETRMSRMGKDAKSSLMFSVAGLPTPLGFSGKFVQKGLEPSLIFGAGMYSDLGKTDMTWEERLIHGGTFLAFHQLRKGFHRTKVKEDISTAIRVIDPTLSEARFRSIKDGKAVDRVIDIAEDIINQNPQKHMLWSNRKNPDNQVEFIRLEKPKTKDGKPKVIFRDLDTGKYTSLTTSTFYKNFSKNVVPPQVEREVGRELTAQEKDELADLESVQKNLYEASVSNRRGKPEKVVHRDVELELRNPFSRKVGLDEVEKWGKKIDETTDEIQRIQKQNKNILKNPDWKEEYPILAARFKKLDQKRTSYNLLLSRAYKKVHLSEEETFDPARDKLSVGEFVKIPAIDESTMSIDYTKASIGKYIGTMKDFGAGEVIAPEWMQREPSRYSNYFKNVPVFEVRVKKGTEKVKVAISGEVPDNVVHAIGRANLLDKPIVEYGRDNPEITEIRDNPIVQQTGGKFQATSWNPNSKLFNKLFAPKSLARGNWEKRESVSVDREEEVNVPATRIEEASQSLGLQKTRHFYTLSRMVRQFAQWWDKTGRPQMRSESQAYSAYAEGDAAKRAAIRKSRQSKAVGAFQTERWQDIIEYARERGYEGSPQDLFDFFKEFQTREMGIVTDTYIARPEYILKKIKSADGVKLFPDGVPTFEGAMRMESEKIAEINDKLATEREKEFANFKSLRGANPSQWPDMNKMDKNLKLEESVYKSYPEFNPEYDKPWVAAVTWDARKLNEIVTKHGVLKEGGEAVRFATEDEAKDYIADHWINQEAIEKLISNNINHISSIRGEEYKIWKSQQDKLHKVVREAGWGDKDYRDFLREFWPESKGSSNNMTFEELEMATAIFKHPDVNQSYLDIQSSILPPADVMFSTKPKLRKFIVGLQKFALPTYTVNMMQDSKVAFEWGRLQMMFEIKRYNNAGSFAQYLHSFKKEFGLSDKQIKNVTSIVDPLFEDLFDPKLMGNLPVEDIKRFHRNMSNLVLVKMLIDKGVEVRDGSTSNLAYKDFFSVYTKAGEKIDLANSWDAVRISKGVEFVDSNLNFNKPDLEKYTARIIEFEPIKKLRYSEEYLKSLRSVDPRTGKVDNGWFIEGNKRYVPVWEGDRVVKLKEYKRNEVENSKGETVKIHDKDGNHGKYDSHIVDEFLTRIVHPKFHDEFVKPDFSKQLVEYWARMNPDIANMAVSMSKKRQAAELMRHRLSSFISNAGSVYGTIFSRIAKLPPIFAFDKNNRLILIKKFIDLKGNPVKKGSEVLDVDGKKQTVNRIVPVYETDYNKLISAYASRVSHQSATYEMFGRNGANNERFLGESATTADALRNSVGEISMLAKETSTDFAIWAHKSMQLHVNSVEPATTPDKILAASTNVTAQLILSTPKAGTKNLALGQATIGTIFGYRALFNAWSRVLRNPRLMTAEARKRGALVAGVHEIITGGGYAKYSPGGMRPTEISNRIVAIAAAEPQLVNMINVLNGIKTPMNIGISRDTAMNVLSDGYKFRDKEIRDMMELGAERLHERPEYIDQAYTMSHGITQGLTTLPFIPQWMASRQVWKSMTLFYRIANFITGKLINHVIKPLALKGNPIPFMRYISLMMPAGAAIYTMHYLLLDKDLRNKFKSISGQIGDLLIRAEWLGLISNAFDEHGDIVDSYSPAVAKVYKAIIDNTIFWLTQKKTTFQSIDDATRQIILAYDDLRTIYENRAKPNLKKYRDSKRRQRQFQDVYFRDEGFSGDESDLLTVNSPEYRMVRLAFWGDDEKAKAESYWAAVKSIMTYDLGKNPGEEKLKHKSRALAFKNLKGIIAKQRPIPSSWRKLTGTGTKTRYDLYYSLLSPEDKAKEDEIEAIYQQNKKDFLDAVDKYRDEFSVGVWGDSEK